MGILDDDDDETDDDLLSLKETIHGRRSVKPKRRVPIRYDDDDEDDPERELVDLLRRIEDIRDKQDVYLGNLNSLLARDSELKAKYLDFQRQGGISAEELEDFILIGDRPRRPRITYSRKHLRLVSSTKPMKRSTRPRLTKGGNDDDDAA